MRLFLFSCARASDETKLTGLELFRQGQRIKTLRCRISNLELDLERWKEIKYVSKVLP